MSIVDLVLPFAVAMTAALVTTPLVGRVARRLDVVSTPSADRWSRRPVPLLGGVAIWVGTLAAAAAAAAANAHIVLILSAGTAMFTLGLVDDLARLKPITKLIGQMVVACATAVVVAAPSITGVAWADTLLLIAWIVAVTNAFNLLDNMDGLCAGVAAIGALALASSLDGHDPSLIVLALGVAGAAAGFLWFNFHPATIFMGDSGSLFLGGVLALLTLTGSRDETVGLVSAVAVPALLLAIPLFDTLFVTLVRKLSARAASVGGRDHTSHRLVALGFSEPRAVLLLYGLAATAGVSALLLERTDIRHASVAVAVLVVALVLVGVRLARVNVYGEQEFAALRDRAITPLLNDLTYKRRLFEVLLDSVLICLSYYTAYLIRFPNEFGLYYDLFVQSLPVVLACGLAGLFVGGIYRGFWRYVSIEDLPTFARGVLAGGLSPVFVLVYLYRFEGYPRSVFLLHTLLLGVLLLGSRIGFRALGDLAYRHSRTGVPTIVYGAGDGGALLVRELRSSTRHEYRLVGFVDDDPSKSNRRIFGLRVLGTGAALPALLESTGARVVIVSTTLGPNGRASLGAAREQTGIVVVQFQLRLDPLEPA